MLERRDYQERIHSKAIEYLSSKTDSTVKSLIIESPTGSGKTIMAMKIAKYLIEQNHIIGWIAHRKELLNQAKECNDRFFQLENIKFISLFTNNHNDYADCTSIIIDECQHDSTQSAAMLHNIIKPKIIVGLTATPYRIDKVKLCFQKIIKDAGIRQLIREGYLAPFDSFIYDKDWTPNNIANLYKSYQNKWGKTVIYFLTKKDAKECSAKLNSLGVKSAYIIGSEPRDEALKAFYDNKLDVLTNVAVLTEGFDCPDLKTVFVRPSAKGPTVQMAGRVLRKHPLTPLCNIVQNTATKYPFTKHANAHDKFIMSNGEWKSITSRNLKPLLKQQSIKLAQKMVNLPQYIKKRKSKTSRPRRYTHLF